MLPELSYIYGYCLSVANGSHAIKYNNVITMTSSGIARVEHIEKDSKDGARCIHPESHPPHELLMQLLLKVLEDKKSYGEAC
jgi:hypothetical protein